MLLWAKIVLALSCDLSLSLGTPERVPLGSLDHTLRTLHGGQDYEVQTLSNLLNACVLVEFR